MGPKRRSKLRWVFADFQVRFIFSVLSLSIFVSGFLGYKLYAQEKEKSKILQIQNEEVLAFVDQFDQKLFFFVLIIVLLQAMALAFLIFHLTQKVAGPIYRIQRELEEAIDQKQVVKMGPVRKNDEFQGFFAVLKQYVETFKDQI